MGRKVEIYDNGGVTSDRYTVILPDGAVIGMSDSPLDPQGFNQYCCDRTKIPGDLSHLGKKVRFGSLPADVKKAIRRRMRAE